jgi:hypothetical protein
MRGNPFSIAGGVAVRQQFTDDIFEELFGGI